MRWQSKMGIPRGRGSFVEAKGDSPEVEKVDRGKKEVSRDWEDHGLANNHVAHRCGDEGLGTELEEEASLIF